MLLRWVTIVGWVFFGLFFSFLFFSFLWIVVHRVERGKSDIENLIDLFLLLALHCIHVLSLIFIFFSHMYKVFLILWVLDLLERNFMLFLCLSDYMGFRFSKPKYSTMFFELCGVSLNDFMHFLGLQV